MILHYLYFALILMALVLVHEAGHMVVAKWCGMRVERFSIFFGKPIASFTRGETEYAIGWLPLGGYVKISGMTVGEEMADEVAHRAYSAKPAWRKVATILAGPAVNIVLAIGIFAAIFWIGLPSATSTTSVASVTRDSAAQRAGLQPGDRLLAVDGTPSNGDGERVRTALRAGSEGQTVLLKIERNGTAIEREAQLQVLEDAAGTPLTNAQTGRPLTGLGFTFDTVEGPTVRSGPLEGLSRGWDFTWFILTENVRVIGESFTSSEARGQVSSIVGVGAVFDDVASNGLIQILQFVGVISLALGIFNLLPILPLDGGHIVFAVAERVKGSAFSAATYGRASFVGFALVMVIFAIALQNDIGRLTGDGFQIDP
jgi:regulator of sigma E protease